jgi:hypothetical protein
VRAGEVVGAVTNRYQLARLAAWQVEVAHQSLVGVVVAVPFVCTPVRGADMPPAYRRA